MLTASGLPASEVGEKLQAGLRGFFRVGLQAGKVVACDGGGEGVTILRFADGVGRGGEMVAVDVVEVAVVGDVFP